MKSFEQLAQAAFDAHYKEAMRSANGKDVGSDRSLAIWQAMGHDSRECWLAVARKIVAEMAAVH